MQLATSCEFDIPCKLPSPREAGITTPGLIPHLFFSFLLHDLDVTPGLFNVNKNLLSKRITESGEKRKRLHQSRRVYPPPGFEQNR